MPNSKKLLKVLKETFEQIVDSMIVIDTNHRIILFNHASEVLLGYIKSEVIGFDLEKLIPELFERSNLNSSTSLKLNGKNEIKHNVKLHTKQGVENWASVAISQITIDGNILYSVCIRNITSSMNNCTKSEVISLVTDKTDHGILITDENGEVIYINNGFKSLLGYSECDLIGLLPIKVIIPSKAALYSKLIVKNLLSGKSLRKDELITKKNGDKMWCSVMSNPIFEQEKLTYCVTIINDITNTKLHEIFHDKIITSIAKDEPCDEVMTKVCRQISKLDDELTPAILKLDAGTLKLIASPKLPFFYRQILANLPVGENVASSGTAAFRKEQVLVTDISKDPLWENYREAIKPLGYTGCLSVPIKGKSHDVIGVIALYYKKNKSPTDLHNFILNVISPLCALSIEKENQKDNIQQLVHYDALTKLPNRSLFYANAEQLLSKAIQVSKKLAVLFLDIDKFKSINDSHGHIVGDTLLIELAARINKSDEKDCISGRLSGDEFVIARTFSDQDELHNFVEKIRLQISETLEINNIPITPSASIGVSCYPEDGNDIITLIKHADLAMYQAKKLGKGRFSYFSHDLNQAALEVQELECELAQAIREGSLSLHYQPQISLKDKSVYGLEALARWIHPKFGSVPPSKFVPIAEDCGLIDELSLWAIQAACQDLAKWKKRNVPVTSVSVNLSATNFHNPRLCHQILAIINDHALTTLNLVLELTEGVLLDTNPETMKLLHELDESGLSFSMDDFGTGYSSLSYLRRIPFKELKLDKSFLQGIENNTTAQSLSRSILQIGESIGIDVIAEGVENEQQLKILTKQGYHVAQGYFFSKPLDYDKITEWLNEYLY